MMGSRRFIVDSRQATLRRTDDRRREALGAAYGFDRTTHRRVRDVLAVPRQEVLNLVSGCNADVKRIDGGFLRERPAPHKFLGKSGGLVGH